MIEKIAPADHPIFDLIARRWSPRAFSSRAIKPESLASLFEAARWVPSYFTLVTHRLATGSYRGFRFCTTMDTHPGPDVVGVALVILAYVVLPVGDHELS